MIRGERRKEMNDDGKNMEKPSGNMDRLVDVTMVIRIRKAEVP